jgi:hypothetical protein
VVPGETAHEASERAGRVLLFVFDKTAASRLLLLLAQTDEGYTD